MRNLKHVSKFELLSAAVSAFFIVAVLISCGKNLADTPGKQNAELTTASISQNSSTRTSTVAIPFENTVFVPCANGGAGDSVLLTGKMNMVYNMTWTDHDFTMLYHDNDHEVKGVGLASGEIFTGSGGTNGTFMGAWVNSQWVGDFVEKTKIVGRNTVFTITQKIHLKITPDGNVVVNNVDQTVTCQ
jgi:hypothetical protein